MEKILVATDGSDHALKAIDLACDLAHRHNCKLFLCHVLLRDKEVDELKRLAELEGLDMAVIKQLEEIAKSPAPPPADRLQIWGRDSKPVPEDLLQRIGREILDHGRRRAADNGITPELLEIEDGPAHRRILDWVSQQDIDTIVLGSRGLRAIEAMSFGSVSQKVSQGSDCTCITVK